MPSPALLPSVARYSEAAATAIGEAADRIAARITAEYADALHPGARVVFDTTPLTEGAPMPETILGTQYRGRDIDIPESGFSRLQIELDMIESSIGLLLDRCRPLLLPERDVMAELAERAPESGLGAAAARAARLRCVLDDITFRLDV